MKVKKFPKVDAGNSRQLTNNFLLYLKDLFLLPKNSQTSENSWLIGHWRYVVKIGIEKKIVFYFLKFFFVSDRIFIQH